MLLQAVLGDVLLAKNETQAVEKHRKPHQSDWIQKEKDSQTDALLSFWRVKNHPYQEAVSQEKIDQTEYYLRFHKAEALLLRNSEFGS